MCTSLLIAPFLRDVLNKGYEECYLNRQPMVCLFYVRHCREALLVLSSSILFGYKQRRTPRQCRNWTNKNFYYIPATMVGVVTALLLPKKKNLPCNAPRKVSQHSSVVITTENCCFPNRACRTRDNREKSWNN
jgi:hypothetical protein